MMTELVGGMISILVGVMLIGTISNEVQLATMSTADLAVVSSWGTSVLQMVPGFFAIAIMGVGVALVYNIGRKAGIV